MDNSVPVLIDGEWGWVSEDDVEQLRKRQDREDDDETEKHKPTATPASRTRRGDDDEDDPKPTASGSITQTGDDAKASPSSSRVSGSPSPLPSPFDNNLDYNFTSNGGKSCPRFLNTLLTSETFTSCYPLSMMLEVCHPCLCS